VRGGGNSGRGKGLDPQALRAFRSSVAKLKRKGIVSPRVDARSQRATRYMRAKVRKFNDVLEGRAIAVPAPRAVREQYSSKDLLETRGRFLIAPKEFEHQRARLRKGLVQMIRPLKNGQEEYVILPWKANDLYELIDNLKRDPEAIDRLKERDEYFSFRLFGHNASDSFEDTEALIKNLEYYLPRLGSKTNVVKHITFQRFKGAVDDYGRNPREGTEPRVPYNSHPKERRVKGSYELQRDKVRAARKAKARSLETPEQRTARLEKQKRYQSRYRQRKWEDE
jgi:hypothetical protein